MVNEGDNDKCGPGDYSPEGVVPAAVPEAQPIVGLNLIRSELGEISLQGWSGFYIGTPPDALKTQLTGDGERMLAIGVSPAVRSPQNALLNAALAKDPAFQPRLSVRVPAPPAAGAPPPEANAGETDRKEGAKVTSADVLE